MPHSTNLEAGSFVVAAVFAVAVAAAVAAAAFAGAGAPLHAPCPALRPSGHNCLRHHLVRRGPENVQQQKLEVRLTNN